MIHNNKLILFLIVAIRENHLNTELDFYLDCESAGGSKATAIPNRQITYVGIISHLSPPIKFRPNGEPYSTADTRSHDT